MSDIIKKTFGSDRRFVNWRYKVVQGRKTKIPYSIAGRMASSTDPATWATYDESLAASDKIGIVFTPAQDLLGIDIDHCLNTTTKEIEHEQKEAIKALIKEADTYTEISPSGEGLHLFLSLKSSLALEASRHGSFEAYTSGRYFTLTNNPYHDPGKEVRTVTDTEALKLLAIIGYPWKNENNAEPLPVATNEKTVSSKLADSEVLERMFASKNGTKIKDSYANTSGKSEDDLSLCSYLAFWTAKDPIQMERIWMASPLGSRKKTQEREDYRNRTIAAAIRSCKEVYTPIPNQRAPEDPDLDLLFTLSRGEGKIYTQNTENMCRILRKHRDFKDAIHYDIFKNTYELRQHDGAWRIVEDNDAVNIQTRIQVLFPCFGKVGKDMIYDAMIKVAKENAIDSAKDYINSLSWDKEARLDQWLSNVYGSPVDKYHKSVGSNWLKGLVKRIIDPGCKFDYVLVLEGPQGSKKSTSLSVLAGGYHVETTMSTDTKDFFMQFQGNLIIEFSEGETLNRTEVKKMKAIITTQVDKYRPAYGRSVLEFPRRCVFAMTTNDEEYLKDETGNRRWLPVKLMKDEADIEWLKKNRDQLFAEAHHRLIEGKETVHELPKQEMLEMQNERRIHYEHEDTIMHWYFHTLSKGDRDQGITIHQVYRDALNGGYPSKMMNKFDEMRISDMLRSSLKLEKRRVMVDGSRSTRWYDSLSPVVENQTVLVKAVEEDW